MATFAIKSDRLVLPSGIDGFGYLLVEDGVFGQVSVEAPEGVSVVDRMGCWVAPGFIDTHIHGICGHDVMDADAGAIQAISRALARRGTTSWLPTTMSATPERTARACAAVGEAMHAPNERGVAAHVLGIYLEGPFFTEGHAGAQDSSVLRDPDLELLDAWQEASGSAVVKCALAPERAGSAAFIQGAVERGVTCSIGHSCATYGEAAAAVLAGAKCITHTFNGMADLAHRDPGIVGLAMTSQGVFAELICDGRHVDPVVVDALVRAKGFEHVVLVSDCLAVAGLTDGVHELGGSRIEMRGGAAYVPGTTTLAGSTIAVQQAVKNVVRWGVVTAEQAIRMASEVPAHSVGLQGRCGQILPGRAADLTVLDAELNLVETYVAGHVVAP